MNDIKSMVLDIEKVIELERRMLYCISETTGLSSEETLRQSERLDTLLNNYDKLAAKLYLLNEPIIP